KEVAGIIEALVEKELEKSVEEVLKDIEEESVGREKDNVGGGLGLAVIFPKATRSGRKSLE
ncbi:hypothetical protein KI387_007745, partial [Taxus chinensis]